MCFQSIAPVQMGMFRWGGGGGGGGEGERHIINYCRPYVRSDLLTEKGGFL